MPGVGPGNSLVRVGVVDGAPYGCGGAVLEQVGQRCREDGDVVQEAGRCQQSGSRAQGADPVVDTGGSGAVQDEQDAGEERVGLDPGV
ncbi:hypothetical protein OG991_44730 [Streptomyces mirabilis]|nr:hypothetical protein [Streptomyces mirabilis]